MELTEYEIDFIKKCIYMASREGFYALNWDESDYDYGGVGKNVLKKLGLDDKTADEYIRGI